MVLLKKKHIQVGLFSSLIIALVFVSTLAGYTLYIQWKKDTLALKYRNSIYSLTADLFGNDVLISNISLKTRDKAFSGRPVLEASMKNNSNKTVTSALVEITFYAPDGTVLYKDWAHPLGENVYGQGPLFPGAGKTRNVLLPGEGMSFRHLLRNCPKSLVEKISARTTFAKSGSKDEIEMVCSIKGLSVL